MAKNDNKKTMTVTMEQAVDAYSILKGANLSKIDTITGKLKAVDALRHLRPIATEYDATVDDAREKLKPEKYDEAQKRVKDSDVLQQTDILRANILSDAYNEALHEFSRKEMSREIEMPVISLGKDYVDKLIEGNPGWTPAKIMTIVDVLG
ncbi:MAG: hypothetical protein NC248_11390 [Bacteroides sp.]|nr:hypothetical protein [Bacteroides sp.]MCM1391044.1 hypothetical protein [Bacteroides sp.]